MLTFLLILFVVTLAVAPLIHFLPSKRQREVARIREFAAVQGLFVEFRDVPVSGGVPTATRNLIYYGKRLPSSRANAVESAAWVKAQDGWRGAGRRLAIPAPLQELSVAAVAASVDQFSCGVYWTESEGEAGVEEIRRILECWCGLLMQ